MRIRYLVTPYAVYRWCLYNDESTACRIHALNKLILHSSNITSSTVSHLSPLGAVKEAHTTFLLPSQDPIAVGHPTGSHPPPPSLPSLTPYELTLKLATAACKLPPSSRTSTASCNASITSPPTAASCRQHRTPKTAQRARQASQPKAFPALTGLRAG